MSCKNGDQNCIKCDTFCQVFILHFCNMTHWRSSEMVIYSKSATPKQVTPCSVDKLYMSMVMELGVKPLLLLIMEKPSSMLSCYILFGTDGIS